MITPDEVKRKSERQYISFLEKWLRGEAFFPFGFSAGSRPATFRELQISVEALRAYSIDKRSTGYSIEYKDIRSQVYGVQRIPDRISFGSAKQFLQYIGKTSEFNQFERDVTLIREILPELEDWIQTHVRQILEHHGEWADLLKVCCFLKENPEPNLYARELPIGVHTKFIEKRTGILASLLDSLLPERGSEQGFFKRYVIREKEPLIRVRFLDKYIQHLSGIPFADFALPVSSLAAYPLQAKNCVITENEINFLTLPNLMDSFAIWGGGFRVEVLQALDWLKACRLYYWGDIDAQGFEILSQFRGIFSDVTSILMDEATLNAHQIYVRTGTSNSLKNLPGLTLEEYLLYQRVVQDNLRLEQEHISHTHVLNVLNRSGL